MCVLEWSNFLELLSFIRFTIVDFKQKSSYYFCQCTTHLVKQSKYP